MRELKFRLYDKQENRYFKPTYEAYKGNLEDISISLSGQLLRRTLQFSPEHESMFPDRYILEQFTGLLDKNGKEIFEGDILRFPPKDEYEKHTFNSFEVFWHDNDCADNHIGWQMDRMHTHGNSCGGTHLYKMLPKHTSKLEIIGNIHDKE